MKIETKYSIGDKVFLIDDNKIHEVTVYAIYTSTERENYTSTTYGVEIEHVLQRNKEEYELFDTKENLLKTL